VEYPGNHTPLVTSELWDKVQQTLSAANTAGDKHKLHSHYLKGSVFCGECGERLIITMSKNRHGTVYPYFICVGRQKKRSGCRQSAVPIEVVERLVEQHYAVVQLPTEDADRVRQALLDQLSSRQVDAEHERQFQQKRLHKLAAERQKLLQAFYNDSIPPDLLKAEQARITSEMEHAKRRLSALSTEFDVIETNLNVAIEFAKHCERAYLAAAPKVRRQLNQAIFEKLYVHEEREVTSELAEPFRSLLGSEVRNLTKAPLSLSETTNPQTNETAGGLRMDYLVDLMGRLSNPPEHLKHLVDRGVEKSRHGPTRRSRRSGPVDAAASPATSEETGRLSNPALRPVQRRLGPREIETLANKYRAGQSLRAVAEALGVHHQTVAACLQQLGIPRRANERKMNADDDIEAARRYTAGDSLATVASTFGGDASTVRRELQRAGTAVRPRRGRTS